MLKVHKFVTMFVRQHGFGETLHGEQEKDENALLMELDKGDFLLAGSICLLQLPSPSPHSAVIRANPSYKNYNILTGYPQSSSANKVTLATIRRAVTPLLCASRKKLIAIIRRAGLRSVKVGEQCEAIVRFPRLFEKYPFPILINSAFLKLADVFRVGSNFLRLCILKVTQQSVRHLDKILNIDEFVHRIYVVVHSNDPIARAITLRTLGCAASIISERKNVQHSVMKSLDSNDAVEVEAAIYATMHFAEQSKSFATSICDKLAEMIESLQTPVETKLKLIPIFQHMHRDLDTIGKVRQLTERLLPSYPARGFVSVTLHTLSQLSARSLVDIPQQVELLLSYVQTDVRRAVKMLALTDLRLLAKKGPHMWRDQHVEVLCRFLLSTPNADLQLATLNVLATLSSTIAVSCFFAIPESLLEECCVRFCYHINMPTVSKALELFTHIAAAATKTSKDRAAQVDLSSDSGLSSQVSLALESILLQTTGQQSTSSLAALQCILRSVVKLCRVCPALADRFIDTLLSTLGSVPVDVAILYCECLSAITSYHSDTLQSLVPDISQLLQIIIKSKEVNRNKLIVSMVTVLFQAYVGERLPSETRQLILDVIGCLSCWHAYQVGRQASRYALHHIARRIFGSLGTRVSTEHYYFWLSALKAVCEGESHLQGQRTHNVTEFVDKIAKAETCYHKGLSALKAAMTPSCLLAFPSTYVQLRTRTLQAFSQVVKVCCSFQTSPPPAIATSLAVSTGQEIHKCGRVIAQLEKCGEEFDELHHKYTQLYCSSFDADPTTLSSLTILQRSCQLMTHVLETILKAVHRTEGAMDPPGPVCGADPLIETQTWQDAFSEVQAMLQKACHAPTDLPLSYHHLNCIEGVAMVLGQVPLCLPRYFFQKLQSTHIKLAISPQQKSANEPISISHDTFLTLKVEGVIQHGVRPGLYRSIKRVQLTVNTEQQSRTQMVAVDGKPHDNPTNNMSQQVEPHNDYFSTQFLLAFPVTGVHQVAVEAAVVDEDAAVWTTGPRDTVTVKSYDEAVQRQKQQQYAAQRQQQRAAAVASGSQAF